MNYQELNQSLFELNKEEFLLAHCISLDLALGKGIALQFAKRFDMRNKLIAFKKANPSYFETFQYGFCVTIDGVANLITKPTYYSKPTLLTLEQSLIALKKYVIANNIKNLAMPKIGCGLDRLDWKDVESLIKKVFSDLDINIIICYL